MRLAGSNCYAQIYDVVRQIPCGKVATYGQVAELANLAGKARVVGYALFQIATAEDIPWQRVVNAKGKISYSALRRGNDNLQRTLLEREGIEFDKDGAIDLHKFGWRPSIADFPQVLSQFV